MRYMSNYIFTNGESRVSIQSRDGAWDPPHKLTLGEWTEWPMASRVSAFSQTLGEWTEWLVIGQLAAARPYKGKRAAERSSLNN